MRIAINLASRPYLELGPLYKRLRILIAVLVLLAAPLWMLLRVESARSFTARQRLAAAQQNLAALQHQEQTYESEMRQPANASVLRQSQFLNEVFARKAFSWTAVMMDLEKVLPAGVQVLNIDPAISRDGDVTIRLRVSGQRDRAVELVRNLEHSRSFLFPRLADEAAETAPQGSRGLNPAGDPAGGDHVNFDILAEYNPLPPSAATQSLDPIQDRTSTEAGPKTRQKIEEKSVAKNAVHRRRTKPASSAAGSKPLVSNLDVQNPDENARKAGPQ